VRRDERMSRLLEREDVKQRVIVLGQVDRELLRALYQNARTFFFPSWVEGFGLPILEAMAAGCPVVTSDRSAPAEVAGDAALTVSPFDIGAMAAALRRSECDEQTRLALIAAGARRIAFFGWQEMARTTLDVLRQVSR
jgi:glycosyltransferase involved in cell wall biosynthesis